MRKMSDKMFYGLMGGVVCLTIFSILYNNQLQQENNIYFPKPLTANDLKLYGNTDPNAVFIYPTFTQNAYKSGCFYPANATEHHYPLKITCSLNPNIINGSYVTGFNAYDYLMQLHYPYITDEMVDKNPDILKNYHKIILLHNEYMTKKEFEAIKNFPHVLYLYPNSAYAQVSVDYNSMIMTLVRGHQYPTSDIANGFGYVTTTKHEYDLKCENYHWESKPNGIQPTCWPEFLVKSDRKVLQVIKDFPDKIPSLIDPNAKSTVDLSQLQTCDWFGCHKP